MNSTQGALVENQIYEGDARHLLTKIASDSVALSVWSPPYFVGKEYERHLSYEGWESLLSEVLQRHHAILKPGGFVAVNIADILCFPDGAIPRIQAENISGNRLPLTRDDILAAMRKHPGADRYAIAKVLGVSEQTVDRRLKNNNVRGGKHHTQTRVKLTGHLLEEFAYQSGLYLYDRRVWAKDPCWANSRWHTNSYRAVDEFEYVYIFWKPGITRVDRSRLHRDEWAQWGSRGVWEFPSVRSNDTHEAKFPIELPTRLIRLLTDPGDLVIDPFVGSGTSGVAALSLGRRFIGFDRVPKYVALARNACSRAIRSSAGSDLFGPAPAGQGVSSARATPPLRRAWKN